jgi:hypothetical protein
MNFFLVVFDAPFQRAEKLCKVMTNFSLYKLFRTKISKKIYLKSIIHQKQVIFYVFANIRLLFSHNFFFQI